MGAGRRAAWRAFDGTEHGRDFQYVVDSGVDDTLLVEAGDGGAPVRFSAARWPS